MIARLKGTLVSMEDGHVILDCGGVGYLVGVSAYTLSQIGGVGGNVTLRIHTQFSAQDGKITLYGFSDEREHRLFDLLISVPGVSASKSMPILSNADPLAIAGWIAGGKTAELKACKGVGKKTADALVFELQEKCELLLASFGANGVTEAVAQAPVRKSVRAPMLDQVGTALLSMGWKSGEVDMALEKLQVPSGATLESLLREALQVMPR